MKEAIRYKGARDLKSLQDFLKKELDTSPKPPAEAAVAVDGLYDLTADNFEEHVSKGYHFIKFYAPWCGHCKRLEPTWKDLAKTHGEAEGDVKIGRVSDSVHSCCIAGVYHCVIVNLVPPEIHFYTMSGKIIES